jgi:hypothetical protein
MTDTTDKALAALQERLKEQDVWGRSIFDTLVVWRKQRQEANAAITALRAQLATARADAENHSKALEVLRPVWAHGWTDDSQAAQASAAALGQLWALLEVKTQTDAMHRLRALIETTALQEDTPDA